MILNNLNKSKEIYEYKTKENVFNISENIKLINSYFRIVPIKD